MSLSATQVLYGAIYKQDPLGAVHPLSPPRLSTPVQLGVYFGTDLAAPLTTSDPILSRFLYTGTGGDIEFEQTDGSTVTYEALEAGKLASIWAVRVISTTIASGLLWCI